MQHLEVAIDSVFTDIKMVYSTLQEPIKIANYKNQISWYNSSMNFLWGIEAT